MIYCGFSTAKQHAKKYLLKKYYNIDKKYQVCAKYISNLNDNISNFNMQTIRLRW